MDVMVEGRYAMKVRRLLKEHEISFDVSVADVARVLAMVKVNTGHVLKPLHRSTHPPAQSMNWRDFHPLNVIYTFLHDLENEFPSICTVNVIGKSVEGRDIKMLKISNSHANNECVWLDGAIHAREWITTSVVTYIADHIARNFGLLPECITDRDWYFLPVLNPDGYAHTHVYDRMWRKNRARYEGNCVGVDLNRNFDFGWDKLGLDTSMNGPFHPNYRGPVPFSEPETKAVRDVVLAIKNNVKVFISFHSYSQVISFPWCYTSEPCPHYVKLLEGAAAISKAIYDTTGSMYKVGSFKDLMYSATGTSVDWCYGVLDVPYTYLIELRSKKYRFLLPKDEILDNCREILNGVKALMEYIGMYVP
ncbi:Carboxypeptidase B [Eumeta japonica]|uniref:Carboxypeptidase B n=1 Tax=Eumeta variegata TaxID=151549 RepID=A0A4C1WGD1_EUMVA|nr:Carboxypeptidase B [Eumeta japonica]